MNAVDFINLFRRDTDFILLDDYDNVLYSGDFYRCQAWLMKYQNKYDIFPEQGGTWAGVDNNSVVIYLTEIID